MWAKNTCSGLNIPHDVIIHGGHGLMLIINYFAKLCTSCIEVTTGFFHLLITSLDSDANHNKTWQRPGKCVQTLLLIVSDIWMVAFFLLQIPALLSREIETKCTLTNVVWRFHFECLNLYFLSSIVRCCSMEIGRCRYRNNSWRNNSNPAAGLVWHKKEQQSPAVLHSCLSNSSSSSSHSRPGCVWWAGWPTDYPAGFFFGNVKLPNAFVVFI